MAAVASTTGLVTSWAGTANGLLVGSGSSGPSEFTLNMSAPAEDVTPFVSGGVVYRRKIPNIITWDGSISAFLNPAKIGSSGLLTFSGMPTSGSVVNAKSWEVNVTNTPADTTAFASGGVTYRTFIPTINAWSASAVCYLDGTTALVAPGAAAAAATLKVTEDGATDPGFTGNGFATQFGAPVKVGELTSVSYSIEGDGDLTATVGASTYASWWFAAAVVALPAAGSLVLQATTGRTYTGSAFWKSLKVSCMVDGVVKLDIGFQGSGTLAIA
jgi:hypothetical protein